MIPRTLLLVVALCLGVLFSVVFVPQSTLAAELDDQFLYLPLVFSGPVEHLLYLPVVVTGQFAEISNPGFEAGYSGWSFSHGDIINSDIDYVRSGLISARLGNGIPVSTERAISQLVTVPQDRHVLSYWQWIDSQDACPFEGRNDYVSIRIDGIEVLYYDICNLNLQFTWHEMKIDLFPYRNMYVDLQLWFVSDDSVASDLFLDDFSFTAP